MLSQKDIEERLISSLTTPEKFSELTSNGVTQDYFVVYNNLFKWLQKYHSQFHAIPAAKLIKANCPEFQQINDIKEDEREYLTGELIKSDIQRKAARILNQGADLIGTDIYGGLDFILSKLTDIRRHDKKYAISYTDRDALKRLESYRERKASLAGGRHIGIKTGFKLFDEKNIGWQPGNLVGIMGRLGIGKSWLLEYTACTAYAEGKSVLYLTPEMSNDEVEWRWDTMMSAFYNYKFPNDDILLGRLPDEKKYEEWLTEISKNTRWLTMESNHGNPFTVEAIDSLVDEYQPDLLCVDGFLMLRSSSSGVDKGWQTMLDIAYGLKSTVQTKKITGIVTTQARKLSVDEKTELSGMPSLEHNYGGDALPQAADIMITMSDNGESMVRYISVPKRRGGETFTKRTKLAFDVNVGKIGQ
jgi:KaiC/GvpD/RAD55 family RecA-like ATPase